MARSGRAATPGAPERRCIATRETAPKAGLIRFVLGPDRQLVPDLGNRLPGRGFYLTASGAALRKAVQRGLFARAARGPVTVPPDLPALVEAGLVRRAVDLIALARKAGKAVAGREAVRAWLVADRAALLVQAADGSPRERAALRPPAGPGSLIDCLTASEIGLAFGRDRVIHAAIAPGGLAARLGGEASRLSGVRGFER